MNNYILGIIFSIGSISEGRLIFRHKHRYFLEQIQILCKNEIYEQINKTKIQYVLKTKHFDIEKLKAIGWTDRNASVRYLPKLDNYRNFMRAYIELHSSLDYSTRYRSKNKKEKYKALRLRIYGNKELINSINSAFHTDAGVKLKSPQIIHNNKTAYIAYTSLGEIETIFTYIKGCPCSKEFWEDIYNKLDKPVII